MLKKLNNQIKNIREKPEADRIKIMWIMVSFCMVIILGVWWTRFTSHRISNPALNFSSAPSAPDLNKEIYNANKLLKQTGETLSENDQKEIEEIVKNYIEEKDYLQRGSMFDLKLKKPIEKKEGSWYVEYEQRYKNIPVNESSISFVIDDAEKKIISSSSNFDPNLELDTNPKITNQQAYEKIVKSLEKENKENLEMRNSELVIYKSANGNSVNYYLAWKINAVLLQPHRDYFYFIDAKNGKVITYYDNTRN